MGNTLRRNRPDDISAYYDIKNKIGSGNFATVKRAIRHLDGREFAIKCIKKNQLSKEELAIIDSEVAVMRTLQHRHVVRQFEIFETKNRIYIVMELLSGGELFDRIVQKGSFSEREASEVIRDLANAISYLHSIGVVHRDLKPENIQYSSPRDDAVIKVTDFGLAKRAESKKGHMTTACGTPAYVAPEVLKGESYDQSVDMWSLGVILYILLCGFPPFYSENTAELYNRIKNGQYSFPSPYWDEVSPPAIELIRGLQCVDPEKRLSARQVLLHPWIADGIATNVNFSQHHTNRIRLLQAKRKLRRNVQIIIACHRFTSILQVAAERGIESSPALSRAGTDLRESTQTVPGSSNIQSVHHTPKKSFPRSTDTNATNTQPNSSSQKRRNSITNSQTIPSNNATSNNNNTHTMHKKDQIFFNPIRVPSNPDERPSAMSTTPQRRKNTGITNASNAFLSPEPELGNFHIVVTPTPEDQLKHR